MSFANKLRNGGLRKTDMFTKFFLCGFLDFHNGNLRYYYYPSKKILWVAKRRAAAYPLCKEPQKDPLIPITGALTG